MYCMHCGKVIGNMDLYYEYAGGVICLECRLDPRGRQVLDPSKGPGRLRRLLRQTKQGHGPVAPLLQCAGVFLKR